jgi:phosphoadenosine phosphosulfate reductase
LNQTGFVYSEMTSEDFVGLNDQFKSSDTLDVIRWAYQTYGDDLVYACSFGAEAMVLLNLVSKVKPDARIVFLDTSFHFKETYELIDQIQKKYPQFKIEQVQPAVTVAEQEQLHGDALWKSQPDLCCNIRKIEPLHRALTGVKAWMSGLRREQSPTRANTQFFNQDNKFKAVKVCPLIHWTWEEVWMYINLHQLPYNPLHDQGYPSIGCEHCTLPVEGDGDSRDGRWSGFKKTECGLHLSS